MALALPAPASAIVNGDPAGQGDYPAQGFLGIDSDSNGFVNTFCSGTLVGSRQFLTAARCTTNTLGQPRPASNFTVRIGDIALPDATVVQNVAANDIPDPTEVPPDGYVRPTGENDIAMLTLKAPVDADIVRVLDANETTAWAPGTAARVLGWGERSSQPGDISDTLLTGDVAIRADSSCPNANFDAAVMLCAAGTPAAGDENPCPSDSGSPLLVPDGGFVALAGVFSGSSCASSGAPGIFARVGADPLNSWVHERTPEADFDLSHQPRAGEPVTLFSTSRHPEGASYFTSFKWNFDGDDEFDDRDGKSISATFPTAGDAVVGLQASRPNGDTAVVYYLFEVGPAPATAGGTTPPTPAPTAKPVAGAPLATILASRRPRVRGRRFTIRVRFARSAPRGTAVIEVYRGSRRIGIARTRVRRGATKRVSVKLTPTGRRLLSRAANRRMRIRVRVRVGRRVLATRQLTIRR